MLEILKRRMLAAVSSYEWNGEAIHLKKLTAASWLKVQQFASPDADEDKSKAVRFYIELLAATLCTPEGVAECDSEEGRKYLAELGIDDLRTLGELSLKHSGLDGTPKN